MKVQLKSVGYQELLSSVIRELRRWIPPDDKQPTEVQHSEHSQLPGPSRRGGQSSSKGADRALAIIGHQKIEISEEENRRILRKTDRVILVILVWVYFLQILDKSVLGYGATYGLKEDTNLSGGQYSLIGSIAPIAQLIWQPFSSYLIVKVPHRILMPVLCLGWGIAQTSMAACNDFSGLMATRFFLGLFEGGCLPLFSVITSQWYRRAEQPIRVAAWYGTNGAATIFAAAISYGLGRIESKVLREWQIIFLFVGLLTVISVPFIYWKLDNDILSARFLTEEEKPKAIERLRANQTGTGNREFKWKHVFEAALEPKTYLWFGMTLLLNVGASVTNTFGPLIINGLGFDKYKTSLLNMPFGALQTILILLASFLAQRAKIKGAILAVFMLPVLAGLIILYCVPREKSEQGALLAGYYLLAFIFAALIGVILIQWANLIVLNKIQAKARVRNGKEAVVIDRSMQNHYHTTRHHENGLLQDDEEAGESEDHLGQNAFLDLTDRENDEFVYIY
ncbi:hypothetical protein TrVGV298_000419 [Trichoderma virens]|nr:hypothetical protein TrVGV298_000419 [Trichoderma virens]